jgi:hypothetical protein
LPAFIIIGASRSGTTSMYDWLTSHPDVSPATRKELHYFTDTNYHRGPRWYRSRFPLARPGRITGESTPQMLYNPVSPERVATDLPVTTRFIALLRDPVDRAISHYWKSWRVGAEKEDLETALSLEAERLADEMDDFLHGRFSSAHHRFSYMARGEYANQLDRWFRYVGRSRIMVLESEAVFADHRTLDGLTDWLGLARFDRPFPALKSPRKSTRGDKPAEWRTETDPRTIARLQKHFEPRNEELFTLLGRKLWSRNDHLST